jgi:hypothetical protein
MSINMQNTSNWNSEGKEHWFILSEMHFEVFVDLYMQGFGGPSNLVINKCNKP